MPDQPPLRGFKHPSQRDLHRDYSRHGGRSRSLKLTPEQRSEIARAGGNARVEKARRRKEEGNGG